MKYLSFPLKITLLYVLIGFAWILASDYLLGELLGTTHYLSDLQGFIFIIVTSVLFNKLISNEMRKRTLLEEELSQQKEHAEESDKLKTAFLRNLSHEIRTPMSSLLGFTDMLKQNISPEKRQSYLKIMQKSINHLLHIIDDIFDIIKIEDGHIKITETECNLKEFFDELFQICEGLREQYQKSHINLLKTIELNENQATVLTDSGSLQQIFTNIISNAFIYTNSGFIEIGCRVENDYLLMNVKDSGVGIPADKKATIFDRYRQSNESYTRKYTGTGLGLAIAKGLVEIFGGTIVLESEECKGSNFKFSIPFKPLIDADKKQVTPLQAHSNDWSNKLVLIVEDDLRNYYYLQEVLRRTKAQLLYASNGEEAIEIFNSNSPVSKKINLILMDLHLPKIDGYEATREIKKIRKDLPIVAQTANAFSEDRRKALDAGCDEYIAKPFDIKTFHKIIEKFL